ncbi:MAG: PEGA domain-containing protein [Candidatus Falkowbacteria bacterium]|nr:PEGA domain-containing protein [Candidatus Falkowbacteria bacterium]
MNIVYRRIIFSFFVLLFCILVPVILIYATGNTINWSRLSLEKTGSILIDSEPNGATVFLNGEKLNSNFLEVFQGKTPLITKAKVNNLAPGEYTIRLEKNGYWPWEEKFRLSPGGVTNFGTIGLFSQAEPELVYSLDKAELVLSPNGEKIALLKNNLLTITDVNSGSNQELELNNLDTEAEINWASNNKKISIGNYIISLDKKTVSNLASDTKKNVSLLRWSDNESMVYFVSNKKILRYTESNKNISELALNSQLNNQDIVDYLIKGDQIYIIVSSRNTKSLLIGSIEGQLTSLSLPTGNYKFKTDDSPKPVLIDENNIYVIDEPLALFSKPRLLEVSTHFKLGHWQDNSLTYASGLELRRWDKEGQEYLLTRFGSAINELWPVNKRNSIIVATPDDIRVYVNGSQPFAITLAPIKNTKLVVVSKDNKTLYVYGDYDGKTGIFKLAL